MADLHDLDFEDDFLACNHLHSFPLDFHCNSNSNSNSNSSQAFISRPILLLHRNPLRISSLDRYTQLSFEIDMFHQSQSQSQPRSDRSFRVQERNHDVNFDVEFGSGLGFHDNPNPNPNPNSNSNSNSNSNASVDDDNSNNNNNNSGFTTMNRHGARSYESNPPEFFVGGVRVTDLGSEDSDEAEETEIVEVDDEDDDDDFNLEINGVCDDESIHLCWDAFRLEDDNIPVNNPNVNEDFEWEEVNNNNDNNNNNGNEEREVLSMFFEADIDDDDDNDDDGSVLPGIPPGGEQFQEIQEAFEWQVLSNVRNFEPTPEADLADDDYNYTEYEMFFGQQFGETDVSSLGRPPASKSVVENLSTVAITQEDVENNNALCAVCKDEVGIGEKATLLPCSHRYHGECIGAWLGIRNTCPVCRYELPTDDVDYELRKTERVVVL